MMWLYDYPNWVTGLLFISVTVGVALSGQRLAQRSFFRDCNPENSALAMGMMAVVAMMLSLLLALSSVSVWQAFNSADASAAAEASVSVQLERDLAVYGGTAANSTREAVRDYLQSVIKDEWPVMEKGGYSDVTAHKFNAIFRRAARIDPRTPREQALIAVIWGKTNELNLHRSSRLSAAAASAVPSALWATLLLGILFNFLLIYILPYSRVNALMLGVYAAMLGLMMFFTFAMDHPFSGSVSISPDAYESALVSMQRWDGETAQEPSPAKPQAGTAAPHKTGR